MASLSSTYASNYRRWPSPPWMRPPNSHSDTSPSTRPAFFFFSMSSDPRFRYSSSCSTGFPIRLRRSFAGSISQFDRRIRCFRAGSSDSTPSPMPPSDPPPLREGETISGALSRIQDTVRIFFAVFFWMGLFFWASAWDGRNGGKHNKGTRFK